MSITAPHISKALACFHSLRKEKVGQAAHKKPAPLHMCATDLAKAAFAQHLDEVEFIQAQALGLALPDFTILARAGQLAVGRR